MRAIKLHQKELKELKHTYKSLQATFMKESKYSELAKSVEKQGLENNDSPMIVAVKK